MSSSYRRYVKITHKNIFQCFQAVWDKTLCTSQSFQRWYINFMFVKRHIIKNKSTLSNLSCYVMFRSRIWISKWTDSQAMLYDFTVSLVKKYEPFCLPTLFSVLTIIWQKTGRLEQKKGRKGWNILILIILVAQYPTWLIFHLRLISVYKYVYRYNIFLDLIMHLLVNYKTKIILSLMQFLYLLKLSL